jgi:hypothetical protein
MDFFEKLATPGPQKPLDEPLASTQSNKPPMNQSKTSITKSLMSRILFQPKGEEQPLSSRTDVDPSNIDTHLTDMMVKEIRQLK